MWGNILTHIGVHHTSNLSGKIIPSLQFRKRALSLASAADAMTKQRIAQSVKNAQFNFMGLPFLGIHPIKK
jgi:hypothetical protein